MFSDKIKQLREDRDLLQKDIAKILNISTSAYGFYEQGKREPSYDTIKKLSDFYGVSIDELIYDGEDYSFPKDQVSFLASKLKLLRESNHLTQADAASKLNITIARLSMIEQGKRLPDFNLILKMTELYHVSTDYLFGIDNSNYLSIAKDSTYVTENDEQYELFCTRFIELYCEYKLDIDTEEQFLGLSRDQILAFKVNRFPTIKELTAIAKAFHVSIDYLLGLSDNRNDIDEEEEELLSYYRKLPQVEKRWVMGQVVDALRKLNVDSDSPKQ